MEEVVGSAEFQFVFHPILGWKTSWPFCMIDANVVKANFELYVSVFVQVQYINFNICLQ